MPRYKILLEYEGTSYSGWQIQKDDPSLQAVLERALSTSLRRPTPAVGSGRTDAGVHARGQVVHFDSERDLDEGKLAASLNGLVPADIAVISVEKVHNSFHARYDAIERLYRYYVSTRATALERAFRYRIDPSSDFALMNQAAAHLVTTADFSSFCKTQSETQNRTCSVRRAAWVPESARGLHYFEIRADRFLHGMVRAIVGTLLDVGRGRIEADDLTRILAARDRRAAGPAAPALGLVLESVKYPELPRSFPPPSPE